MRQKQLIVGGVVLVVVIAVAGAILGREAVRSPGAGPSSGVTGPADVAGPDEPATYSPLVPSNAVPTVPTAEAPIAPGVGLKSKQFALRVTERGYEPAVLAVRAGDATQIHLTAEGGDYDFSVPYSGLYQFVRDGETKQVTFRETTAGTFRFSCRDHCPPGRTIEGSLVVLPE